MTKIAFSDMSLRKLAAPAAGQRCFWDQQFPAFGVRVSQGGTKTFVLSHANSLITIGRFPILSLSLARAEAKRVLAEFTLGKSRPRPTTYAEGVKLFIADKARSRRTLTVRDYKRLLGRMRFSSPIANITHAEAAHQLARIKAPHEYNHALVALRTFFNWTVMRRMRSDNPTSGLSTNATLPRARVLLDDELRRIWIAAESCSQFGVLVRLLMLTGQRRTETASIDSSWMQEDALAFPAHITKSKRDHMIPLAPMAKRLLPSRKGLLFPARARSVPFNGWSKGKLMIDRLSGVTNWTLHDLRRTFATRLAEMGTPPHVIERLLNHVTGQISGVAAIYNRASYQDEMRAALAKWEERLSVILAIAPNQKAA
jgi:integrase